MLRPDILFCLMMLIAVAVYAFRHPDIDEKLSLLPELPTNPGGKVIKDKIIELLKI